jgi:hypothetical protein
MKLRASVLREANWQCCHCERVVPLEVHHADGNPANNDRRNLIVLCHDCHMVVEAEAAKHR